MPKVCPAFFNFGCGKVGRRATNTSYQTCCEPRTVWRHMSFSVSDFRYPCLDRCFVTLLQWLRNATSRVRGWGGAGCQGTVQQHNHGQRQGTAQYNTTRNNATRNRDSGDRPNIVQPGTGTGNRPTTQPGAGEGTSPTQHNQGEGKGAAQHQYHDVKTK